MIFSERYKDFIDVGNGECKDIICGEITLNVKKKITNVLVDFAEPIKLRPYRYDNYELNSNALQQAIEKLNEIKGFPVIQLERNIFDGCNEQDDLWGIFTPWFFDLIELQYIELSEREKVEFQAETNTTFRENAIPWLLYDGKMIKIDSRQFECDMRAKALMALHELKESDSKFQAAYEELMKACEFLLKESFAEAVANAEKSYESVLKVVCGLKKGNADILTTEYVKRKMCNLPETMTYIGFREKVMMALPFIRNNSSSSHGAGELPAIITEPLAKLAVNLSSAMSAFLIEEYKATLEESVTDSCSGGE